MMQQLRRWLRSPIRMVGAISGSLAALLISAVFLYPGQFGGECKGIGGFDLNVNVVSQTNKPIAKVFHNKRCGKDEVDAEAFKQQPISFCSDEEDYLGNPTKILVWVVSHGKYWGLYYREYQPKNMIFAVQYADGQTYGTWIDIPDHRISRNVTVKVP